MPPNQALEPTGARRTFTFQMIKAVLGAATLALGGGRSAWSRYAVGEKPWTLATPY